MWTINCQRDEKKPVKLSLFSLINRQIRVLEWHKQRWDFKEGDGGPVGGVAA